MHDLSIDNSAVQITTAIGHLPKKPQEEKIGRGIVIAAGGLRLSINAWVNIRMLRRHGCDLPIQVWYLGDGEYSARFDRMLSDYGATMHNACDLLEKYPHQRLNGWELKPYAIAHSSFDEVLFLDADNVAAVDPTYLMDDERFREVGTMFWPDYGRLDEEREAWQVFGVEYRDEPEVESGQVMVIKSHPGVWQCLALANWLMQNSNNFFFDFVHGDKEIFHMAWRRLGQSYVMPDQGIEGLPGTMCQHDLDGQRVFQHRNMRKWNFEHNEPTDGFWHEKECMALVDELAAAWSPCSESDPTSEDVEMISRLDGCRFLYVRVGHDHRQVVFNKNGTLGEGGGGRERHWTIRHDEPGEPVMIVAGDDGQVTMRLKLRGVDQSQVWSGQWLMHEKMPILLVPLESEN